MTANETTRVSRAPQYAPGHPWYYLARGDNMPPVAVADIAAGENLGSSLEDELPRDSVKRENALRELLAAEERSLTQSIERYRDIAARGADALSVYDRTIAYGGDLELARASSLALVHNHISWHKGRIAWLKAEIDAYGPLLF